MTLPLMNSQSVHEITVKYHQQRVSYNASSLPEYIGEAPQGRSVDDEDWTINKFTYDGSNLITLTQVAFRVSWTNRTSTTYA